MGEMPSIRGSRLIPNNSSQIPFMMSMQYDHVHDYIVGLVAI